MPETLITSRRFLPLLVTQTLGALNDNLFKNALAVMILYKAMIAGGESLVALAGGAFILPYAALSATAGQLADQNDKARLIRIVKLYEVGLMLLAVAGFLTGSIALLFAVLFGLGVQATFFSPLKYGILPDHLAEDELVRGNAMIEAGTFGGILVGTIAGGALIPLDEGEVIVSALGILVALAGAYAGYKVLPAPAEAAPTPVSWNVFRETADLVKSAKPNRPVWLSILGLSWFWTIGATLLAEFPVVAKNSLHADSQVVTLLLTVFAVGVGAGSILCGRLLKGEVSARHVPFAALGLSLFTGDFAWTCAAAGDLPTVAAVAQSFAGWHMFVDLFLLAMCGGVYSVPLYVILQERSEPSRRSRMVAANNVMNAAFMVAGAVVAGVLAALGMSAPAILVIAALANLVVAVQICRLLPQELFRALLRWYFETFHRPEIVGLEHAVAVGDKAVIVVNHLSLLDGCFVAAYLPGSPVFAIDTLQAAKYWYLKYIVEVFPVDPMNAMSTKSMVRAVKGGRSLVIFPEGRLSLTGGLMKIYDGPGTIADKAGAPVLPIRIEGLEFHKSSRLGDKLRQRWFPKCRMTILPPRPIDVPPDLKGKRRREALTKFMSDAMTEAAFRPEAADRSMFQALLDAKAKFDHGQAIIADALRNEASYGRIVLGAAVLGRRIAALTAPAERVGVLLPNSVAVVLTFFGLHAYGRVPAMLNFSVGSDGLLAAAAAAQLKTVLTSRAFIEKGKLDKAVEALAGVVNLVYLEDLRASIGVWDKLAGKFASLMPRRLPGAETDPGAAAVILFTSGSEGTPKGVVLSHRSLLANCGQVRSVVDVNPSDRLFNALPVFHSFGLTGGMLLPLVAGMRSFFYPSPLHYKLVPELVYADQSTIMFGTDSFLTGYARKAKPEDLQSLRFIVAGAERVKAETRAVFWEKFQKPIYEGYGATELAPVVSLNTPSYFRTGTVGRLLPGIEHRLEPVAGFDRGGRLFISGPNVMSGYLKADAPGVLQPPADGWYDTGDIVDIDADGFVTILGRAKRFAKIAGEMVSLSAAENLAQAVWPDDAHAVVAAPDPRKGERLILVTSRKDASAADLLSGAKARGIAEMMVPRQILVVDKVPLLGTGKIDYPAVAALACAA